MTDIKRYEFSAYAQDRHDGFYAYLEYEEYQEGDWVKFEDIEHLISENKRLKEENEILNLIRNSTQFN